VRLFGTPTSPYTRKIRILTAAAKLEVAMIDTRTDQGAAALAATAPLGKVPVIEADGLVLPDSALITSWLWSRHAPALRAAGFSLDPSHWDDRITTVIVDGALDAAINRFYLRRDGFDDHGYVLRQRDRVESALTWLEGRLHFERPVTPARLALGCALDWMVFRDVVDLRRHPPLEAFRAAWITSGIGLGTEPTATA
jgi:glutathione S-transferase